MTQMKASRSLPNLQKTVAATVEITPIGIKDLRFFLNGLLITNKNFSESVAHWQTKNEKKLSAAYRKALADDKVIDLEFVEKNEKGQLKLWDGIEAPSIVELRELIAKLDPAIPAQKEEIEKHEAEIAEQTKLGIPETFGRPIGFTCFNKELEDGANVFVDVNGKEMPQIDKELMFYVADPKRRDEWHEKKQAFTKTKYPVNVIQINRALIENMNIPTMLSKKQGDVPVKMNRELFYDSLVMPDEDETDVD